MVAHVFLSTDKNKMLLPADLPQVSHTTPGAEHAAQSGTEHATHCRPVGPAPVPNDPGAHDVTHSVWSTERYLLFLHTLQLGFAPDPLEQ